MREKDNQLHNEIRRTTDRQTAVTKSQQILPLAEQLLHYNPRFLLLCKHRFCLGASSDKVYIITWSAAVFHFRPASPKPIWQIKAVPSSHFIPQFKSYVFTASLDFWTSIKIFITCITRFTSLSSTNSFLKIKLNHSQFHLRCQYLYDGE